MSAENRLARWAYFFVIAAGFVVVVAGLQAAREILAPFLMAVFFAILFAPPLFWLQQVGLPRLLAVIIVIAGFIGIWLGAVAIVARSLDEFPHKLETTYKQQWEKRMDELDRWSAGAGLGSVSVALEERLGPDGLMRSVGILLSQLGGVLKDALIVLITVVFILLEATSFPVKLRATLPDPDASLAKFDDIALNVRRYLVIKTVISLLTGAAATVALLLIGVDFPFVWGLLAFLFNFIPYIGSLIAAIPAVFLAFIEFGSGAAVETAIAYLAINQVLGTLIEPKLMGHGLGLSPLVVLISLVFWGWVLGPVGMLLSVVLTMILKIAMKTHKDTRWIAILLGPESSVRQMLRTHEGKGTNKKRRAS